MRRHGASEDLVRDCISQSLIKSLTRCTTSVRRGSEASARSERDGARHGEKIFQQKKLFAGSGASHDLERSSPNAKGAPFP